MKPWTRRLLLGGATVLVLGGLICARAQVQAPAGDTGGTSQEPARPSFSLGPHVDAGGRQDGLSAPFDLLVSDMDLDGDDDLLLSRHFFGLLLFENDQGGLVALNQPQRDQAGLDVPPGVRTAFGRAGLVDQVDGPAVIAWVVRTAEAELELVLRGRQKGRDPKTLRVQAQAPFEVVQGDPGTWKALSPTRVDLEVPRRGRELRYRLRPKEHTPRWSLQQLDRRGDLSQEPLPVYLGEDLDRFDQARLEWWSDDPHGMAWAQLTGSPEPELVVVRGGNLGTLQEQGIVKEHGLYTWVGQPGARYQAVPGAIPADPRRGRAAEWIDIDNDGLLELLVTNRDGPASLLVWRPGEQRFEERADTHGLDAVCSEQGAWLDLDQDGWQDLVSICEDSLEVAHNLAVGAFVIEPGQGWGLDLPQLGPPPRGWLREDALQVLDINGDDRLDLWMAGLGEGRVHRVLLARDQAGFADATDALGLGQARGVRDLRPVDADMDGWLDALVRDGDGLALLWSQAGQRFERIPLEHLVDDLGGLDPDKAVGVGLELDGDGRTDLFVGGGEWRVLLNRTDGPARALDVVLDSGQRPPPVGAELRATYADGHLQRVRVGSHARSGLSQAFPPVRLGVPAPGALRKLEVRWAGSELWQEIPVGEERIVVEVPPVGL